MRVKQLLALNVCRVEKGSSHLCWVDATLLKKKQREDACRECIYVCGMVYKLN